jgi:hypothetical protein
MERKKFSFVLNNVFYFISLHYQMQPMEFKVEGSERAGSGEISDKQANINL